MISNFLERLKLNKILLCDGAMGTELQKSGLKSGDCPEELNLTHPGLIQKIHSDYLVSGSDIIETNTFGANRQRLKVYGLQDKVKELNEAAVKIAKAVCPSDKFIAGSIGPLGDMLEPYGEITEAEAFNIFKEQAIILENAGVDVIFIETMMSIEEMIIAAKAVKENCSIPVSASMTFELGRTGLKTSFGVDIPTFAKNISAINVDIIGSNCGKGFNEMLMVVRELKDNSPLPILAQANAGIPSWIDGKTVYSETPDVIGKNVKSLIKSGVKILGGCCGTTPAHIKKMREFLDRY